MPLEAIAWSLIVLLGPSTARALRSRLGEIDPWWIEVAGWIHAFGLPFLAVIFGSISARAAGVIPFEPVSWLRDLLVCCLVFLAVVLAQRAYPHRAQTYTSPLDALSFEPRWALYRASASLWVGDFTLSVGAGMLLGVLDLYLDQRPWERNGIKPSAWATLMRLVFSSLVFWATHNLWITIALQIGLILMIQKRSSPPPRPAGSESPDERKTGGS
jgi:hypothetical protein